jgi:hypothetical protein
MCIFCNDIEYFFALCAGTSYHINYELELLLFDTGFAMQLIWCAR